MHKLTDTQLIVLKNAATHANGAADRLERLPPAAAFKVGAALASRGLMQEIPTRKGMPIWRTDGTGRGLSLVLTGAGREALGLPDDTAGDECGANDKQSGSRLAAASDEPKRRERGRRGEATKQRPSTCSASASPARTGTKQDAVVNMLSSPTGATIATLMAHTGWLPHTTRAVLSGLRKRGHAIERVRDDEGQSHYRITSGCRASVGA